MMGVDSNVSNASSLRLCLHAPLLNGKKNPETRPRGAPAPPASSSGLFLWFVQSAEHEASTDLT